MVNEEIVRYIRERLGEGVEIRDVSEELTSAGWTETDINQALRAASSFEDSALYKQEQAEKEQEEKQQLELKNNPPSYKHTPGYTGAVADARDVEETGSLQRTTVIHTPLTDAPGAHGIAPKDAPVVHPLKTPPQDVHTEARVYAKTSPVAVKKIALIAGLLVGVSALVFVGYSIIAPRLTKSVITPEEVMRTFWGTTSHSFDTNLTLTFEDSPYGDTPLKIVGKIEGSNDRSLADVRKKKLYEFEIFEKNLGTYTAKAESIQSGEDSFFRLTEIPDIPVIDLNSYKNTWVELSGNPRDELSQYPFITVLEDLTRVLDTVRFSQGDFLSLFSDSQLVVVTGSLPDVASGQGIVYARYTYDVVEQGLDRFYERLMDFFDTRTGEKGSWSKIVTREDFVQAVIEMRAGEVWVGKKDSLPYKIIFKGRIYQSGGIEGFAKKDGVDIDAEFILRNYNAPVQVVLPTTYMTLGEASNDVANPESNLFSVLPYWGLIPAPSVLDVSAYIRDLHRLTDLFLIEQVNEEYFAEFENFAPDSATLVDTYPDRFFKPLKDPVSHKEYSYSRSEDGQSYHSGVTLEKNVFEGLSRTPSEFNSRLLDWRNGFDGTQDACTPSEYGEVCYDISVTQSLD